MVSSNAHLLRWHQAIQRRLIKKIIERFAAKGLNLATLYSEKIKIRRPIDYRIEYSFRLIHLFLKASKQRIGQHSEQLQCREFYFDAVQMESGFLVPMVWECLDTIKMGNKLIASA